MLNFANMTQKIVIPKGLIDPNETTIIEIPERVQNVTTIIAKHPGDAYTHECSSWDENYEYDFYENDMRENNVKYMEEDIEEYYDEFEEVNFARPKNKIGVLRPTFPYPNFYEVPQYSNIRLHSYTDFHQPYCNEYGSISATRSQAIIKPIRKPSLISPKDILTLLDAMDKVEYNKLQKNLKEFQTARRKLLYETTNLNTFDDISNTLSCLK